MCVFCEIFTQYLASEILFKCLTCISQVLPEAGKPQTELKKVSESRSHKDRQKTCWLWHWMIQFNPVASFVNGIGWYLWNSVYIPDSVLECGIKWGRRCNLCRKYVWQERQMSKKETKVEKYNVMNFM